ncbi:hypothetical protein HAX54_012358 [Datura stramonium]|uniref:Uncharacterized protein n=1 Tax=Datura stramonium TaxID=4076 RepID=A0ABS8TJM7_DATST|nr:hypothetical protein [Datura stramonium]
MQEWLKITLFAVSSGVLVLILIHNNSEGAVGESAENQIQEKHRICKMGFETSCENGSESFDVDMSWEICQGSADFMQKIRFNSGLKLNKSSNSNLMSASSVVKTCLPLPGPHLGNSSFPQESYFEITILPWNQIILKSWEKQEDKLDLEKISLLERIPPIQRPILNLWFMLQVVIIIDTKKFKNQRRISKLISSLCYQLG